MLPKNLLAQPLQMHPLLLWQLQATTMQLPWIGTYLHHSHQLLLGCRQTPKSFIAGTPDQALFFPLRKGAERWPCQSTCSFLINELSQIKGEWVSIPLTPVPLLKKVQNLTQSYSLSFHNVHILLTNSLLPDKGRWVLEQVRIHADQVHQKDGTYPTAFVVVTDQDPE